MSDGLQETAGQAAEIWRGWSMNRRLSVVLGIAFVIAGIATLVLWTAQDSLVPLMSNLSGEDASAITERLSKEHVKYRLAAGGSTILVPESQVYELRLKVAGEGLPRGGGVGFEMFEKQNFGMSQFAERMNYVRALQGELQRTIRQIEAVQDARVHIVLPQNRLFRASEEKASASISLQLHRGRRLSDEQVNSIVHLASSSIAGLQPQNVTVVDSTGATLHRGGSEEGDLNEAMAHQRKIERSLEERLVETLERVVGPGNATAQVNVQLDYSKRERTMESYDPDSAVIRSEMINEEQKGKSEIVAAKGIPGTRSNLGGGAEKSPTGGGSRRSETRNYEINKVTSREVQPVANIAKLSVAVLVNGVATSDKPDAPLQPRGDDEVKRLESLVRRAVGFSVERGDQIEIQSLPFSTVKMEAAAEPPLWVSYVGKLWRPVIAGLLFLMVASLLLRRRARPAVIMNPPRSLRELEASLSLTPANGAMASISDGTGTAGALSAGEANRSFTMAAAAPKDAKRAAAVLKEWMVG